MVVRQESQIQIQPFSISLYLHVSSIHPIYNAKNTIVANGKHTTLLHSSTHLTYFKASNTCHSNTTHFEVIIYLGTFSFSSDLWSIFNDQQT
jgi:hypothetical protein